MKILIAGGTGFIGQNLARHLLEKGNTIYVLARNKEKAQKVFMNTAVSIIDYDIFSGNQLQNHFDAIINLSGESIGSGRWTKKRKKRITESRVATTRLIVSTIKEGKLSPKVLISASAVGYYGDGSNEELTEHSGLGKGFLADVCKQWEKEVVEVNLPGVRKIILRTAMVLGKNEATSRLLMPHRYYIGGSPGNGLQWVSWIHIDDVIGIIDFLINKKEVEGPVNLTSPQPLRMKDFQKTISLALKKPYWFKIPKTIMRLIMGEMADLVLLSQRVMPKKLINAGYKFKYPTAKEAFNQILK